MNCPALLIQYDPETWTPTAIFCMGRTDEETAKIQEIADIMLSRIEGAERSEDEN